MNLGVERFLILGCLAVVILELPHLLGDVESASVQAQIREQMLVEKTPEVFSDGDVEMAVQPIAPKPKEEALAALDLEELLPARAGL